MDKENRKKTIDKLLSNFRGTRRPPLLYFDSEVLPHVEYHYDENDDCLHADVVSEPFHYKIEEITNDIIFKSLDNLHVKL